jgi:hypothetical protein
MMSIGNLRVHRYTHESLVDLSDADAVVDALDGRIASAFAELFVDAIVYLYERGVRPLGGFAVDLDTYQRDDAVYPYVTLGDLEINPYADWVLYFVLARSDEDGFRWLIDLLPQSFLASIEWGGRRIYGTLMEDEERMPGCLLLLPDDESLYGIVMPTLIDKLKHLYLKLEGEAR